MTTSRGWLPAARYTNLRDIRGFSKIGFIDIDWKAYDFQKHLAVVQEINPFMTVARDIEDSRQLDAVLNQASLLAKHVRHVVIVPKCQKFELDMERLVPKRFLFGYSVPTRYGGTLIQPASFKRPVHLLGGSPRAQLLLSRSLDVFSLDCNRFTLDARYGDFFDGERFRQHPQGGYERCLIDSIEAINDAWRQVRRPEIQSDSRTDF
jgi:hypothetical protein